MKNKSSYLLMYSAFFIYSLSSVFSKMASKQIFLSLKYLLFFAGIIFMLGIYAFLWQQVLKKIPISVAMSNKPIVIILGTLWAVLFFNEMINKNFFIGMTFIVFGLFVIGVENE